MNIFKGFLKCILFVILLIVMLWLILLVSLQTEKGQRWFLDSIINYIEQSTEAKVQIERVEFTFPLQLRIHQFAIKKDQTTILSIQRLDLSCKTNRLLEGHIVCPFIHAKGIDISDLALNYSSFPTSSSSSYEWGKSTLPFYVKVENLWIENLRLGPALIDHFVKHPDLSILFKQSHFQLQGNITNNPFRNLISAHLVVIAIDQTTQQAPFNLALDIQNQHLSTSLHLNRFPLTFINHQLAPIQADIAYYAATSLPSLNQFMKGKTIENEGFIEGTFKLKLMAQDFSTLPCALIGLNSTFKGKYTLSSAQEVKLFDVKIESPCATLQGEAIITSDQQIKKGLVNGQIDHLELIDQWISTVPKGKINLNGQFSGSFNQPYVLVDLASPQLVLNNQTFQDLSSTISSQLTEEMVEGSFHTEFKHHSIPYQGTTYFIWNRDQYVKLSDFQFHVLGADLKGYATFFLPTLTWDGEIKAYSNDLSRLSPFTGFVMQGNAQLDLHIKPKQTDLKEWIQEVQCQIQGGQLHWSNHQAESLSMMIHFEESFQKIPHVLKCSSQVHGNHIRSIDSYADHIQLTADYFVHPTQIDSFISHLTTQLKGYGIEWSTIKAQQIDLYTYLEDPFKSLNGEFNFACQQLETPLISFQELIGESQIHPNQTAWPFKLDGKGFFKDSFAFATGGSWYFDPHHWQIQVDHQTGHFGPHLFEIINPYLITRQQEINQLSSLHFFWGGAEFAADVTLDQQNIACQLKGNQISSDLIHLFAPDLLLTGTTGFTAQIEGPLQNPKGQLRLFLYHMQIAEQIFTQKPFIEGEIDFNLIKDGVKMEGMLHGIGNNPVLTEGVLPITLSLSPPSLDIHKDHPFRISLQAEGELDPYLHLFYNDTSNLSGQTKIAISIQGKMDAPQIQGEVDLYNGAYESLSTGAIFKNIQARLEGDGSRLILKNFSAQDDSKGTITANGFVKLDAANHFPFEFQLQPSQIFIIDADYASISASGPLTLVGNQKQAKLQGTMTIDKASISMEEALPAQVKSVEVKYINIPQGEEIPSYVQSKESNWLNLDVKLNIPSMLVTGKNLNSDWKGTLQVTGHLDSLLLYGDLRVVHGEYNFNGKMFNLTQGNIHFAGSADKKTSLYVVASKEIERIKAEMIVKGPVNKLAVSFRSDPPLSQREVLSYILFNRGISDITPDQGTQLSQSFMTLDSTSNETNTDFLSRLRKNMGIDRLDFNTSDSENRDLSLQIGKYIAEGVFISINKNINSEGYRGALEANIHKNLKAQLEMGLEGEDSQGKAMLKWKKDY